MAGHTIKISAETYAHVILAAAARGQTITQWMEVAALTALQHQDQADRVARFRDADRRAAERREMAPQPYEFGLAPHQV